MYTEEQKMAAVEVCLRNGRCWAEAMRELGYPARPQTLAGWFDAYADEVRASGTRRIRARTRPEPECPEGRVRTVPEPRPKKRRRKRYSEKRILAAVDYYLAHGRNKRKTMRDLGYPGSHETLTEWIDQYAPGTRRRSVAATDAERRAAVSELLSGAGSAREVAGRYGVGEGTLRRWRRLMLGDNGPDPSERTRPVAEDRRPIPDDIDELRALLLETQERLRRTELELSERQGMLRRVQLELDVREATLEILKKDPGTDPNRLTNQEKARIADLLRDRYALKEILPLLGLARSSYAYARGAGDAGRERREEAARLVEAAFEESGGIYGYRRIRAATGLGEWTVRRAMAEAGMRGRTPKRRRRYSSYAGEVSKAPPNLLKDGRGRHHFFSKRPNELWVTDVTEFRVGRAKVYLSLVVDCFDGLPAGWAVSRSPDARLANTSLLRACSGLSKGEHPVVHSDRGGHYRWPGWIAICGRFGLTRSMSAKGSSPDNARCEGVFGRIKEEFFHGRDWSGVGAEEFADRLDAYLLWYRDERLKSDLGYRSPMQYRRDLGLVV